MAKRFVLAVLIGMASLLSAQDVPYDGRSLYDWGAVAGTGQLGKYVDLTAYAPTNYTINWTASGTAASACTFRVEGSNDKATWIGLDATAPAADSAACTSSGMIHIADKPVRYLRVYLVTYTAGDGTTSVKFQYTAGR